MKNQRLGRGLASLLGGEVNTHEQALENVVPKDGSGNSLDINMLVPTSEQPRKFFEEEKIKELRESIEQNGIIQPIIVKKTGSEGKFSIIAGERRWRAAQMAGLKRVPVVIKDVTSDKAMELALIENIHREDLNPIEEAEAYKQILDSRSLSQNELSKVVSKSRSHVANTLRLLNLAPKVREAMQRGDLTAGHARTLLSYSPEEQEQKLQDILSNKITVREAESLKKSSTKKAPTKKTKSAEEKELNSMLRSLEEKIGLKVTANIGERSKKLIIHMSTFEELDSLVEKLSELK